MARKKCYLIGIKGWAKYRGNPRPAFGMDCLTPRQKKESETGWLNGKKHAYIPATCKSVQRHWDFNKKYATYDKEVMDKIFRRAKRLCTTVRR